MPQRGYTQDAELILSEGGAVTSSGAPQKNSADIIKHIGNARFEGVLIVDVAALDIVSNNELYRIIIQGSTSATFASNVQNLGSLELGATEVRGGGAIDSTTGRYEVPFTNESADTLYPYIRLYTLIAGTTPSINYTAWVAERY